MLFLLFVFARIALGTLLREATRGAPFPSAKRRIFGRFGKSFLSALFAGSCRKDFLNAEKAESRRAAGRGISTKASDRG
jgi:hypothetical protein